ncbi:DUF1624 domain-containing protein [Microvirga flavescens]|uniref:DUF1624 domain-containing protein n=1 Tax=Microvirga flavescens TaxID=2249811 RepID=UPI000DD88808|nr:heparan-alpha-glucosaminide N-acetyltransferase [Microvirga flavescens]
MRTQPSSHDIASQRWDAIDIARGVAIGAMIIYHFSWDLSYLQLISTNIFQDAGWRWFARSIAGSFLFLVGIGLALAHAKGFNRVGFLWRLARIGGSAALITVATYFAFPQTYIFFGILHCIAVSSVLALPFLRAPVWLTVVTALACFVAPSIFTSPNLDAPWLDWLGLGSFDPSANDYVPIFPWFGIVLLGLVAGRGLLAWPEALNLARWKASTRPTRALLWAGRKSLPIYLLHQPLLLAALYGVLQLTGPSPTAEMRPFIAQCEADCAVQNSDAGLCRTTCTCVATSLRKTPLWRKVLTDNLESGDQRQISRIVQQCLRETPPNPSDGTTR